MKPIEEVLATEEAKWRAKPYGEIETNLGAVQSYKIVHGDVSYQIEIHSRKGKKQNEIIVMVEVSKNTLLGSFFGRAKYFVISKESGVREIENDEAF
jgi:hypothetical protein